MSLLSKVGWYGLISGLTAAYYILLQHEPDQYLGANYLDERRQESVITRICTRIKQLGYQVNLEPIATSAV